jgi:hypothetical protein
MNVRDLDLRIVTEPDEHLPAITRRGRAALVTYETSAYLTPTHVDVTNTPATYARAKAFTFPSKRQLRAMDADRWVRQRMKTANLVAVSELSPARYSLDNLASLRTSRFERTTAQNIRNTLHDASMRFDFTRKTVP